MSALFPSATTSIKKETWPSIVELLRTKSEAAFKIWVSSQPDSERDKFQTLRNAALVSPVVEYTIPHRLRLEFAKSTFPLDVHLRELFYLPFPVVAFSTAENRENFWIFVGDPNGSIAVIDAKCMAVLPPDMTVRQLIEEQDGPSELGNAMEILATMCYLRGGDHREVPIPAKKGKKYRNRMTFNTIRGEVGGKFVSALRRYEAQQEAAPRPHGSPRPHLRAGHFALYWTGKGSRTGTGPRVPKIQFIHPCLVNADSVGPDVEIRRVVK